MSKCGWRPLPHELAGHVNEQSHLAEVELLGAPVKGLAGLPRRFMPGGGRWRGPAIHARADA